jgi:outer membrane lipoprotein-sorting protein
MKIHARFAPVFRCAAALVLPLMLSGCSYFIPTKRHLPVPKAPAIVQTATPEELVKQLNQRWGAVQTLTATVEIYATETKTGEGITEDLPSCRGIIIMRKPKMLRVRGTYFGLMIFDMASDGNNFTLVIPSKNTAIEGANTVTEQSPTALLNLRPDFFLDAIAVRGMDPDDEYMVASDTETVEDTTKKHLYTEPEYVLSVMHQKSSHELLPSRVITFHRDDMLPYEQWVFNSEGVPETQIYYSNYTTFSAGTYPSKVTIKRPQEGIQIVLNFEAVHENVTVTDSQFQVPVPKEDTIKTLK